MDLYRLVHGKSLWIFLAVITVLAVISAATMAYITDPAFVQSMQAASASGAPTGVHIGFSNGSGPSADDLAETNALVAQLAQGMTQMQTAAAAEFMQIIGLKSIMERSAATGPKMEAE